MRVSFKFNPAWRRNLPASDRRPWLLRSIAFSKLISTDSIWTVEIYFKRLLVALGALALAFYLAAASGLYLWLARNPHNQVGWSDLSLPWHWRGLRTKLGDTAILDAQAELARGNYVAAYFHLSVGVARSPGNAKGRTLLARLILAQEPVRALALMEEGLPNNDDDVPFLSDLMALYQHHQANSRALATIERLQGAPNAGARSAAARDYLATAKAAVLLSANRPAEAAQALAAVPWTTITNQDVRRFRHLTETRVLLRLDRAGEALQLLDQRAAELSPPDASLLVAEAEACLATGNEPRLQSVLRRLKAIDPENPVPYIFAFECWHRLKRPTLRDIAENEFYQFFANSDTAMHRFAATLVNLGLDDMLIRARSRAQAAGVNAYAFNVNLTELSLRRGDFEEAIRFLRNWETSTKKLISHQQFYPEFIRHLTRAAFTGKEEQTEVLLRHLDDNRVQVQPAFYQFAADILMRSAQADACGRLLQMATTRYPHSDPLRTKQVEVEQRLAEMRPAEKPAAAEPAPEAIAALPADAGEAFSTLDSLLQNDSLAESRDLIRRLRQAAPSWLPANETALAVREIELSLATEDALSSRNLIRRYLAAYPSESAALALVTLAQKQAGRQRLAGARLLRDEVRTARQDSDRVSAALEALPLPDDLQDLLTNREATLQALDEKLTSGEWIEAERLWGRVQSTRPAWAADAQIELRTRQVRLLLGLGQKTSALLVFRELVASPGAARFAAFGLVRQYAAAGAGASAVLLATEASRLLPGDPAAERLLQEARVGQPPAEM
ncbi:MAG: hypothetical protein PHQ04_11420 [Opitutaceae bacterium]|nr:hypothetical protein [Opitutaceae bacterium]